MQWIPRGQQLNTLEKQAPICTLGVGGRPLLVNLGEGGELFFRSLLRGGREGTDGSADPSPPSANAASFFSLSPSDPLPLTGKTPASRIVKMEHRNVAQ